ncbi:hypothetical protein DQ04_05581050 [Trypanosoma grayi]|uniref:hypothetical protein n=1 Tax=Trypanosoma grayi TaxID=71804 RepID=UPI0004F4A3F8|nr:hypothetical protein DQ04_05581050 [Trypanosoma grayi]KEG09225.1 hypothetical protein DQ04_05581050 [Trypanosoma grayi]
MAALAAHVRHLGEGGEHDLVVPSCLKSLPHRGMCQRKQGVGMAKLRPVKQLPRLVGPESQHLDGVHHRTVTQKRTGTHAEERPLPLTTFVLHLLALVEGLYALLVLTELQVRIGQSFQRKSAVGGSIDTLCSGRQRVQLFGCVYYIQIHPSGTLCCDDVACCFTTNLAILILLRKFAHLCPLLPSLPVVTSRGVQPGEADEGVVLQQRVSYLRGVFQHLMVIVNGGLGFLQRGIYLRKFCQHKRLP